MEAFGGIAILVFFIYILAGAGSMGEVVFCKACGFEGKARRKTQGNILIEIILWLCFIVPGIIYSIWRLSTKKEICDNCQSADVIPPESAVAIKMKKELGQ